MNAGRRGSLLIVVVFVGLVPSITGSISQAETGNLLLPDSGAEVWTARYNGPGNQADEPSAMATSPDGSTVFVTGASSGPGTPDELKERDHLYDYLTVAYDAADGGTRWEARYDGPAQDEDIAADIAVSPDGSRVFVTGYAFDKLDDEGHDALHDVVTIAYDADGRRLWISRYDGPDGLGDGAQSVEVSPDGSLVFVSGTSAGIGTSADYVTIAYNANTGRKVWVARYEGTGDAWNISSSLAVNPNGTMLFVTGSSGHTDRNSEWDFTTVAYDADSGAERWVRHYDGPRHDADRAHSVAVTPDGSKVFVTGGSWGQDGDSSDYATVAYEAESGAQLWTAAYDGLAAGWDVARHVLASPDGSKIFVTGESQWGLAAVAYAAARGDQLWVARDDADVVTPTAAIAGDGAVLLVGGSDWSGSSRGEGGWDYATLAHATDDGTLLADYRYDGGGGSEDLAASLAVGADGLSVFATGSSGVSLAAYDYATVSYRLCSPRESGVISGPIREHVEPLSGPASALVHKANCQLIAPNEPLSS